MKKSCFKKVAALLTTVVMLAAVLAVPASAAQVVNTELLNRGFVKTEKVLDYKGREAPTGWQRAEGNVVDFEAAADANGVVIDGTALKLDFNANLANNISNYRSDYNWFGYYQNVKVEKYTEYTFSFWVLRNAPATSAVALGQVKAYGGDDTNLVKLEAKKTTGGWEYLSGTFNSGNNDAVTVQLFTYAAGVDSTDMVVYFDYVSLQKGETVPPEAETPENLIANGDMELFNDVGTPFERLDTRSTPHWEYDGANFNGVVKPYERISGVSGYGLTATNRLSWLGQIYQTVTLEANTDYTFSFYEKANSTDAVMFGYVIPENGTNNDTNALIKLEKGISSVDTWQKLSGTFNSGDVTSARVVLRYYKRGATTNDTIDENCRFSFDEMVLAKQEKAIVANGDMELFNDVGTPFERLDTAAAQHWHYDSGNFNGVVKPYDRTNGVTGYGLTATNRLSWLGQIYQTVTLEANTDYTFSFYEKANYTDAVMFGYIVPETGTNNETNSLIKLEKGIAAADTWQQLSGTFNSGDVTNARIVLRYYKRGATTNDAIDEDYHYSFDDVAIVKAEPHVHTYAYTDNGATGHTKYCLGCEESVNEAHTLVQREHADVCDACGYFEIRHTAGAPVQENVTSVSYDEVTYCSVCNEELSRKTVATDLVIGTQTKNGQTRLVMKLCADAETIEAYDSVAFKVTINGVEETIAVDCVYDSFYNNGSLVTAANLNCTYVAILEIGNVSGKAVSVQGVINDMTFGVARTLK